MCTPASPGALGQRLDLDCGAVCEGLGVLGVTSELPTVGTKAHLHGGMVDHARSLVGPCIQAST